MYKNKKRFIIRPTQASMLLGLVHEYRMWLGRHLKKCAPICHSINIHAIKYSCSICRADEPRKQLIHSQQSMEPSGAFTRVAGRVNSFIFHLLFI